MKHPRTLLRLARLHPHMLGHLSDQGQPVQSRLINAAHVVVHKQAGQQHCQREDLGTVLRSLHAVYKSQTHVVRSKERGLEVRLFT
jgi:hypothetical protein